MEQTIKALKNDIEETKANLSQDFTYLEEKFKERVREETRKFSPTYQVQSRPLVMVGGALAAGTALGALIGSRGSSPHSFHAGEPRQSLAESIERTITTASHRASSGMFSKEIGLVKALALQSAVRWASSKLEEMVPNYASDIHQIAEGVASKLNQPNMETGA